MKHSSGAARLGVFCQRGVSLVELMVALVLSLILVAGVGQIYMGSKQTYRTQDGQSRLQENARYALEVLTRDIRSAGYLGCGTSCLVPATGDSCPTGYRLVNQCCQIVPVVIASAPLLAPNTATAFPVGVVSGSFVSGGDDNSNGLWANPNPALSNSLASVSSGNPPPEVSGNIVGGTDAITVIFGESCGGIVTTPISTTAPSTANLSANNTCGSATNPGTPIAEGTPLVIADCNSAHIFRASSVNPVAFGKTYNQNTLSEIFRYRSYTYYIRFNPSNQPALYRYDNNSIAVSNVELVEGIENMQIFYGVDTLRTPPSSANQYLSAGDVKNWSLVVSVQIRLNVRSVGENANNVTAGVSLPRAYNGNPNYGDTTKGQKPDQHLFKTFTSTVSLRNRVSPQ